MLPPPVQAHADALGTWGSGRNAEPARRAWEGDGRIDLRSVTNCLRQLPYHVAWARGFRQAAGVLNPTVPIDTALESCREMGQGGGTVSPRCADSSAALCKLVCCSVLQGSHASGATCDCLGVSAGHMMLRMASPAATAGFGMCFFTHCLVSTITGSQPLQWCLWHSSPLQACDRQQLMCNTPVGFGPQKLATLAAYSLRQTLLVWLKTFQAEKEAKQRMLTARAAARPPVRASSPPPKAAAELVLAPAGGLPRLEAEVCRCLWQHCRLRGQQHSSQGLIQHPNVHAARRRGFRASAQASV